MSKKFRNFGIFCSSLVGTELIFILIFSILYFNNVGGLKNLFFGDSAVLVCFIVIALNVIAITIIFISVYYLRKRSDIKASQIIGKDVNEAYNFGTVGLVLINNSGFVIWENEFLLNRNINILNKNIFDWNPSLINLKSSTEITIKEFINKKFYEIKFLKSGNLFLFKDITDIENLTKLNKENSFVVCNIVIDNFSDSLGNDDDSNDTLSKIRNAISDYSKQHHMILRRYRNDAYIAICKYEDFENMKKESFEILNTVRQIGKKEITPPTLSIGFAYGFPDILKLEEMSNDAIDIAMSRGGDQVVVSEYSKEIKYFGGRTEALETRNKVKVRVIADSLISRIKAAKNVLVMGHKNADMDAIGSCLGIYGLCEKLKVRCSIVYEPKAIERKARGAFTYSFVREEINKLIINFKDAIDSVNDDTLLILVDCHSKKMALCSELVDKVSKIIVIDHHRRSEEYIESPLFSYIDPSASSASELICEIINYCSLNPPIMLKPKFATIMLSGIYLDSTYFKTKATGIRTFEACMLLKQFGADNALADEFLKDEFEEITGINQFVNTTVYPENGFGCCVVPDVIVESAMLSKIANRIMEIKGTKASFVVGKVSETDSYVSCRSGGFVNVQVIAEFIGGGGHFSAAAAFFKNTTPDEAFIKVKEAITKYIKQNNN